MISGMSGQLIFDIVISTVWAILFTGLPIIVLGIYDMDVHPETALRYPWLYRNGVDDELFSKQFFWGWIAQVRFLCQGCALNIPPGLVVFYPPVQVTLCGSGACLTVGVVRLISPRGWSLFYPPFRLRSVVRVRV